MVTPFSKLYRIIYRATPQRGWAETVDTAEIDCATIWQKILELGGFTKLPK